MPVLIVLDRSHQAALTRAKSASACRSEGAGEVLGTNTGTSAFAGLRNPLESILVAQSRLRSSNP